LGVNRQQENYW